MKKLAVIFVCISVLLSAGVSAADRGYYKLEKGSMIFVNALHLNRFIELIPEENVAKEYFNDLLRQKLAMQTNEELIVYKFDKFSAGAINCYRIKIKNEGIIKFINTYTGYISSIKFKDGDILGWVDETSLKKIK